MHRKRVFRNTISFCRRQMIFCRILFHIISLGKHFPMSFFFNFLQWIIWICSDIIAMLFETLNDLNCHSQQVITCSNRNSRKSYEICSKLTIKKPERCQWRCFGVFIVNLKTYFTPFSGIYCSLWTISCLLKLNY